MNKSISFKAANENYFLIIHSDSSIYDVNIELRNLMKRLNKESKSHIKSEMFVKTGSRLLSEKEKEMIYSLVEKEGQWRIRSIESDVITRQDAIKWNKEINTRVEFKNVSSGEILDTKGDILLIGDVEPGGFVRATGNIFILGDLRGIADAGYDGNKEAVIIGTFKNNSEIRINKITYSIKHRIGDREISLPLVYYLTQDGTIGTVEVNRINEIRPSIDQVIDSFR